MQELRELRDKDLAKQLRHGKETLRQKFPHRWSQSQEDKWLTKWVDDKFPKYLDSGKKSKGQNEQSGGMRQSRPAVDEDDDEPDTLPKVKREATGDGDTFRGESLGTDCFPTTPFVDDSMSLFVTEKSLAEAKVEIQTRRRWVFKRGRLVVSPPFEVPPVVNSSSAVGGPGIKREDEDRAHYGSAEKKSKLW